MNRSSDILTILHVSDIHFGTFHYLRNQKNKLYYWFEHLKNELKKKNIKLDLIVITGDIGSEGKESDFIQGKYFIENCIYKDLNIPLIIVPGNHDLQWAISSVIRHEERFDNYLKFINELGLIHTKLTYKEYFSKPHFFKTIPEIQTIIFGINSCLYNVHQSNPSSPDSYEEGYFKRENEYLIKINEDKLIECLENINKDLLTSFKFKIAILHHNILQSAGTGLLKPDPINLIGLLRNYGFDIILHGHLHKRKIVKLNNSFLIGAGSFGIKKSQITPINDVNIIKVKLEKIPIIEKPIKKVCVKTFQLNYDDFQDPIYPLEQKCEIMDIYNVENFIILKNTLRKSNELVQKKFSEKDLKGALGIITNVIENIKKYITSNQEDYINAYGKNIFDEVKSISNLKALFYQIQSQFKLLWKSGYFDESLNILVSLAFFPIQFFYDEDLQFDDFFINKISELKTNINLLPLKSKLDIIQLVSGSNTYIQKNLINSFLKEIGQSENNLYKNIDFVYVPPIEYRDIWDTLRDKRIVFLTGTPEYGKTFTAIYLLWRYYNLGYEPKWITKDEFENLIEIEERMEKIKNELKPGRILYFEDPFGKITYESREGLEQEIRIIFEQIEKIENVFIIFTSRIEIFKEFKKESLSDALFKMFEVKLNIKKPSYDSQKKKEILTKWSMISNVFWLSDPNLRDYVFLELERESNLPTPLNIKDFVLSTIKINNKEDLRKEIINKSFETHLTFSKEIKNMDEEKQLFLLFLFILGKVRVEILKSYFNKFLLTKEIKRLLGFDGVLRWFKDDKILIDLENQAMFSHPSYSEALKYLIFNDLEFKQQWVSKFLELINTLSLSSITFKSVAFFIAQYYNNLPEKVKQILFKPYTVKENNISIAKALEENFKNFTDEESHNLLCNLVRKQKKVQKIIARILRNEFDLINKNSRTEILIKLTKSKRIPKDVTYLLLENYNTLRDQELQVLFNISINNRNINNTLNAIADNFNRVPQNVKNIFLGYLNHEGKIGIIYPAIAKNFNKFPDNVKEILIKNSYIPSYASAITWAIVHNYNQLPENLIKVIFKYAENDNTMGVLSKPIMVCYYKLPENIRNLLFKLCEKEHIARNTALSLKSRFKKLPENIRNSLLIALSKKRKAFNIIEKILDINKNIISEAVKNEVFSNIEKITLSNQ